MLFILTFNNVSLYIRTSLLTVKDCNFKSLVCTYGLWTRSDLYRATPAITVNQKERFITNQRFQRHILFLLPMVHEKPKQTRVSFIFSLLFNVKYSSSRLLTIQCSCKGWSSFNCFRLLPPEITFTSILSPPWTQKGSTTRSCHVAHLLAFSVALSNATFSALNAAPNVDTWCYSYQREKQRQHKNGSQFHLEASWN